MPLTHIPGSYRQQYLNRLELAMNYIEQNLSAELDLSKVAQAAHFSPYHFHRIFTALMDETPQDYISRQRVERAANFLLKTRSMSITEIAFACGFTSSSAFSRSFKKHFGVTARDYIRQHVNHGLSIENFASREEPALPPDLFMGEIEVKQIEPIHLAYFASRRGYDSVSVKTVWKKLFQWAGAHSLFNGDARLVAISFDDPEITPPTQCRYYACITAPSDLTVDSSASFFDFPQHLCAVCRIKCSVQQFPLVYRALYRNWLPDSGFIMADFPPYEIYYDAPDVHPESRYEFDLCIPIALF